MVRRVGYGAMATVSAAAGLLFLNGWLGRRWGATAEEVRALLPGDELIPEPTWQGTHGITIHAAAADIWPWLVQMGVTRGGWYRSEWLDRAVWRMNSPSADRVVPELQHLSVGDVIPDSTNGTARFQVARLEPNRALVLHSRRHPATGIWPDLRMQDPGLYVDFVWAFVLRERSDGTTRLLIRVRGVVMAGHQPAPTWMRLLLPIADFAVFLYTRQMLRGIKRRVERSAEDRGLAGTSSTNEPRFARPARET